MTGCKNSMSCQCITTQLNRITDANNHNIKAKAKKKRRTKISVSNKLSDNAYFDIIKDSSHTLLSFRESQATVAIANEEHKAWNLKQMAR